MSIGRTMSVLRKLSFSLHRSKATAPTAGTIIDIATTAPRPKSGTAPIIVE